MHMPLEDILVADLSRVLAGPLVGMTLGDLGADVIKVESPTGDDTRSWKPPVDDTGRATYHHAVNRNKRALVLDLKD
jgi:crotonobetainyl-CoA:carnitine CoA-transferase CaiB-like acyl-CoA transferase